MCRAAGFGVGYAHTLFVVLGIVGLLAVPLVFREFNAAQHVRYCGMVLT